MVFKLGKDKFNADEYHKHYALKDKKGMPIKMVPDMQMAIKKNTEKMKAYWLANPEQDRWTDVTR